MRGNISAGSIQTPIGWILVHACDDGLKGLDFCGDQKPPPMPNIKSSCIDETLKQLEAYFVNKRKTFDLPIAPEGTPFQLQVWRQLQQIPWGHSRTYGDIARFCKNPKASRAVGLANNRNPLPIIVPCHRVIGCKGKLVGYGGGLGIKRWLLQHEGIELKNRDTIWQNPSQLKPRQSPSLEA